MWVLGRQLQLWNEFFLRGANFFVKNQNSSPKRNITVDPEFPFFSEKFTLSEKIHYSFWYRQRYFTSRWSGREGKTLFLADKASEHLNNGRVWNIKYVSSGPITLENSIWKKHTKKKKKKPKIQAVWKCNFFKFVFEDASDWRISGMPNWATIWGEYPVIFRIISDCV